MTIYQLERPVKVKREQLPLCSRKAGKVGSQVIFTHLILINVSSISLFDLESHLKAEGDEAGECSLSHLGFLSTIRLNKEGCDLGAHLVNVEHYSYDEVEVWIGEAI